MRVCCVRFTGLTEYFTIVMYVLLFGYVRLLNNTEHNATFEVNYPYNKLQQDSMTYLNLLLIDTPVQFALQNMLLSNLL